MTNAPPLITVVIPTFDSAATLQTCLESLGSQTSRDFETVIIDGGSRDTTLAIARRHAQAVPAVTVVSEPDRGIYDAINKGIALAKGRWILVLGSDDRLHDEHVLESIAPSLGDNVDLVYGRVFRHSSGRIEGGPRSFHSICLANICQQAIFYRRELFARHGCFDLRYPLCADWAFNIKCFAVDRCQSIDRVVADYAGDGRSATTVDTAFYRDRVDLVAEAIGCGHGEPPMTPFRYLYLDRAKVERQAGRRLRAALSAWRFINHALRARLERSG